MKLVLSALLLATLLYVGNAIEKPPLVKLDKGLVQGTHKLSENGRVYSEFLGIPYARPPIGKLRFEPPKPMKSWSGTWIANQTTACTQISHWPQPAGGFSHGSEDCLHLNVFVPSEQIHLDSNYDVIVHIHGGAFMFGGSNSYAGAKFIMNRDVILVNINYRVGVFGFLSTGDDNLPGNLGMKDQSFALKWIKENIQYFGGNPKSITITGLSAGGASVHYHYLSALSKNLFTRGISVSGCALNSWTLDEKPLAKTKLIGATVGCKQENTKDLVACLKTRSVKLLNEATRVLRPWLFAPFSPLGLVIEGEKEGAFLTKHPYELITEGNVYDVPWIVTASSAEGLYPVAEMPLDDKNFDKLDEEWKYLAPYLLHYSDAVADDKQKDFVSKEVREFYFGNDKITKKNFDKLIELASDRLFIYDLELSARLHSKAVVSPVYFYFYDYTSEDADSLAILFTGKPEKYGVCHGDDIYLIFSNTHVELPPKKFSKNDLKMRETLIDIWINYSSMGVPLPYWKPVSKKLENDLDYLYIGSPSAIEMRKIRELGNRKFWEKLPLLENANIIKTKANIKQEL